MSKLSYQTIGIWFVVLLGFAGAPIFAQEEEGYDVPDGKPSASWYVSIDAQGKASSSLSIAPASKISDSLEIQSEIAAGLREALHCTIENIRVQATKYSFNHSADCRLPVRKNGLLVSAVIKPAPLADRLQKAGLPVGNISLAVPRLGNNRAPDGYHEYLSGQTINYAIFYKPGQATTDFAFEFGYTESFVIWLASSFSVILVAPILLILYIRAKTLKLAARDSTAAWFGYWRVHRWIAEGIWVVWLIAISVFHFETFLQFVFGHDIPALNAAVYFLPPGIVSFLCQYLTRPLWSRVRGITWNRGEMLISAFWQHVAAVLPIAFIVIGIGSLVQHGAQALAWFVAAIAVKLFGAWKYGKATKTLPHALHGGELKEKILELAQRAGVKIQQVFLMPAGRLQMGNAFAMQSQRVMVTDYLLERLTKRETDCVMAHEIGHVKKQHTLLLSWPGFLLLFIAMNIAARVALTIVPSFLAPAVSGGLHLFKAVQWIEDYLLYAVSLVSALLIRYFLSRRFERSADEFAALLTNDPESMITGLVKLSKMNLMPIRWGRWDEGLSTHPSTLRRAQAVAKEHDISEERLRELIETEPLREEGTGYTIEKEHFDSNLVFSTEKKTKTGLAIALIVLLALSLPPLLLGKLISAFGLPPAAYAAGIVLMPLVYLLVAAYASLMGYGNLRTNLRERMTKKGITLGAQFRFTGIVPEPFPRNYDNNNVWDVGFMGLEQGALVFHGDKAAFAIPRDNIVSIKRGQSSPGWFNVPEIYITWSDGSDEHIFHLHSLEGNSMLSIAGRSRLLLEELLEWHRGTGKTGQGTDATTLGLPVFPDVKGQHPRRSASAKNFVATLLLTACAVFGLAALLRLDSSASWYGVAMAAWCLLLGNLPLWRYRDSAGAGRIAGETAAGSKPVDTGSRFVKVEKEKAINRKLAIGIGVLGIGAFVAAYAAFIMMMSNPYFLFGLVPSPAFQKAIQSDGRRIYRFTHKIDMSTFDPKEDKQPADRHFAAVLDGARLSEPREIPAFVTAAASDKGVVLFGDGFYSNYDGAAVSETKTEGIGKWPKGIATPGGLFVLSRFKDGMKLTNIQGSSYTVIPFPEETRSAKPPVLQMMQPVRFGDQLGLFWSDETTLSWTLWNGASWAPAASQPFSGYFQVTGDGTSLHFFHQEEYGPKVTISHYVFENNDWQSFPRLPIPENVFDWNIFMHRGTPMIFIRQGSAEALYTIDKGRLVNPILLKAGTSPFQKLGTAALVFVAVNLILAVLASVVSAVVAKYKKKTSLRNDYEFASLFRRFFAKLIDAVLLLLLPLAVIWFTSSGADAGQKAMSMTSLVIAVYFAGGLLYHSLCEGLFGATAGKKLCGIRVLKNDFTPPGLGAGFVRNVLRIVDSLFFYVIGAIALAATLKWQRFGDLAAETVVVRNK